MTALSLHELKPARGTKRHPKRVGRGNASGKGTTAGRGTKGQKARTGGRGGLRLLGARRLIMSTPKLRGFKSLRSAPAVVNLGQVAEAFANGGAVTPRTLVGKGLVASGASGIKILAGGEIKRRIVVSGCRVSGAAREKILAAGGEVR